MALTCTTPDRDLTTIRTAREMDVLKDINPMLYPQEARVGNQCVYCADSDQAGDIIAHHGAMMRGITQRHGWLGLYGGALLLPPYSPLNNNESGVILEHLFLGHLLGKGATIPLLSHAPCGMARLYKLDVLTCLKLLTDAKTTVREFFAQRKASIEQYRISQLVLRRRLGREPEHAEIELESRLSRAEVAAIQRAENVLYLKGLGLEHALSLEAPQIVAQFQVDYGALGGERKKRTYMLDRHALNNWLQIEEIDNAQELRKAS